MPYLPTLFFSFSPTCVCVWGVYACMCMYVDTPAQANMGVEKRDWHWSIVFILFTEAGSPAGSGAL